jgi:ureidoglycolate lyase
VLTPLYEVSDFLLIDRGGPGDNLEEHHFADPWLIVE